MQHSSERAVVGNPPAAYPDTPYAAAVGEVPPHAPLEGDAAADLLVIGGGFTGLATALYAAERGLDVVLVEAARIGWGASGRNGGQVVPGFAVELDGLAALVGEAAVRPLWELAVEAVADLWREIERRGIACEAGRGHLMAATKPRHTRHLAREMERLAAWGYDGLTLLDAREMAAMVGSARYVGGRLDPHGGHVQPLKLALGMAAAAVRAGVRLHERTTVTGLDGTIARTSTGRIRARAVVLAGNAYLTERSPAVAPLLERKALRAATYMIATEPLEPARAASLLAQDVAVCDTNHVLDYFRLSKDHRLLFGAELSTAPRPPEWIRRTLGRRMRRVFPQLSGVGIDFAWSGMIDLSTSRMPHLGRLRPGVWFAQGFSGHGVALTHYTGRLLAGEVAGAAGTADAKAFARLAGLPARDVPGGLLLRTPVLALARRWFRLQDLL